MITNSAKSILEYLRNFWQMCKGQVDHPHSLIALSTHFMNLIGLWNVTLDGTKAQVEWHHRLYKCLVVTAFSIFAVTIALDVTDPEAYTNIVVLGEDLCIISAVFLVVIKAFYFQWYKDDILCNIVHPLCNRFYDLNLSDDKKIQKIQKYYYYEEAIICFINYFNASTLFVALSVQPMFATKKILPFRAKFPFDTSDNWNYAVIYSFQVVTTFYLLQTIMFADTLAVCALNESGMHISIVSYKFAKIHKKSDFDRGSSKSIAKQRLLASIKEHQELIRFTDNLNRLLETTVFAQFMCSTSIICLTAFELTITVSEKSIFIKFVILMIASFAQLLYWCWVGNKMFTHSTEIAQSAFDCQWYEMEKQFKQAIGFVIKRSQKPIVFRAGAMYAINFETFIAILSGSYQYCTLLRNLRADT